MSKGGLSDSAARLRSQQPPFLQQGGHASRSRPHGATFFPCSRSFVDAYVRKSDDEELLKLLNFYKCYRAYVRGKVGCSQYEDPYIPVGEKETILASTRGYFNLAESYI